MTRTPRFGFPMLAAGQAQKEVTHNEALMAIDCRLHAAVETRGQQLPPADPSPGAMYIVAAGAGAAWTERDGMFACWDGFGWRFVSPVTGCLVWIVDEAAFSVFDGGWSVGGWPVGGLRIAGRQVLAAAPVAIDTPSGGDVVDSECRATLAALVSALHNQGIVL